MIKTPEAGVSRGKVPEALFFGSLGRKQEILPVSFIYIRCLTVGWVVDDEGPSAQVIGTTKSR